MAQAPNKVKRNYSAKDSVMIIAADVITDTALANYNKLQEVDTTYNTATLGILKKHINTVTKEVLGIDGAAALRSHSIELNRQHEAALYDLGLTKTFIENKYKSDPIRRDELLKQLGFVSFYTPALRGTQEALGHLLSRFNEMLTPALENELTFNGLAPARVANLRENANTYQSTNVLQEGSKQTRSTLTDENITRLNNIYNEVIAICKVGQQVFPLGTATHDGFVFSKVVAQQSSYTGNAKKGGSDSPDKPAA